MILSAVQYCFQHLITVPNVSAVMNLKRGGVEMECSLRSQHIEQCQQDEERPSSVTWRTKFSRWRQLRRERYALRYLSDDMLKDIGLSREDVQRESRRPFWDDRGWRR